MRQIRVLIVDASVVVRRLLSNTLSRDPDIEVIAAVTSGKVALERIERSHPDLVMLDEVFPESDGVEVVHEIRGIAPQLPIIMFGASQERGSDRILRALAAGANLYISKPAKASTIAQAMQYIAEQVIPKIKELVAPETRQEVPANPKEKIAVPPTTPTKKTQPRPKEGVPIEIVAIGVSAGGPQVLGELMPMLPKDLGVPLLIVQHMPASFTTLLSDRLAAISGLRVEEATHGQILEPNTVYVAPGDRQMGLTRHNGSVFINITEDPPENSCRPSVDYLFRSVAAVYGNRSLGVILTGMGSDGLAGSAEIVSVGGSIIVQDSATSVIWGMPGLVAEAGFADAIVPLEQMHTEILERLKSETR